MCNLCCACIVCESAGGTTIAKVEKTYFRKILQSAFSFETTLLMCTCLQAIAAEFNCIRNRLATAPEEDWQQLSMQHADLFRESRDIAEQMEEKVGQLIALKHTGLL